MPSKSLFAVIIRVGVIDSTVNTLAEDASSAAALRAAIAATLAAHPGAEFRSAHEIGARPIAVVIPAAVTPATDGEQKSIYEVAFRSGSGPDGGTPTPVLVEAWPQTSGDVTTSAEDLAISAAAIACSAVPNNINRLANVDIDATTH